LYSTLNGPGLMLANGQVLYSPKFIANRASVLQPPPTNLRSLEKYLVDSDDKIWQLKWYPIHTLALVLAQFYHS